MKTSIRAALFALLLFSIDVVAHPFVACALTSIYLAFEWWRIERRQRAASGVSRHWLRSQQRSTSHVGLDNIKWRWPVDKLRD